LMGDFDDENLWRLLQLYNGAVSFHVASLLVVTFGQFSVLLILPTIKSYQHLPVLVAYLTLLPFALVYVVILLSGCYFVRRYLTYVRSIRCINRRMNERYRSLEASIERDVSTSARWPEWIPNYVVTEGKEQFLYLGYFALSLLLFILVYVAA